MGTGVRHRSSASARAEAASPQPTRTTDSPRRPERPGVPAPTVHDGPRRARRLEGGQHRAEPGVGGVRAPPPVPGEHWGRVDGRQLRGEGRQEDGLRGVQVRPPDAGRAPVGEAQDPGRVPGGVDKGARGAEGEGAAQGRGADAAMPPRDEEAQAPGRAPQGEGGEDPHEDRLVLGEAQLPGGAHAHARRGGSRRPVGPLPRDDEVGRRPLGDDPHSRQGGDGDSALPFPFGEADHGDCGFLRRVHAPSTPPADPSAPLAVPALWTRPRGLNGLWIPARGPSRITAPVPPAGCARPCASPCRTQGTELGNTAPHTRA